MNLRCFRRHAFLGFRIAFLTAVCGSAFALTIDVPVAFDGELIDRDNDDTFETIRQDSKLQTTSFRNPSQVPFEVRAAIEFDLTAITTDRELVSAAFIGVVSGTSTPPGFTELSFDLLGYEGDGQITLSDALLSDQTVGVLTIPAGFPGFGPHVVPLDRDFVAARLADRDYLGLLTRSEENTGGISIRSGRFGDRGAWPTLRLVFVPEPGAGVLALLGASFVLTRRRATA